MTEAHLAILDEEFPTESRAEVSRRLLALAMGGARQEPVAVSREQQARLLAATEALQTAEEILAFMKSGYEIDRRLDLDVTLGTAGRGAVVAGKLLDGISTNPRVAVVTKWIARLGRVMVGFAELAAPRTPAPLLRYWAWLLALLAVLMIGFGVLFTASRYDGRLVAPTRARRACGHHVDPPRRVRPAVASARRTAPSWADTRDSVGVAATARLARDLGACRRDRRRRVACRRRGRPPPVGRHQVDLVVRSASRMLARTR